MKIFYICDTPIGKDDAASTHILELCKSLYEIGCDITLIAPNVSKYSKKNKFKIIYLPTITLLLALFYQIILFVFLCYQLLIKSVDIIYTRQGPFLIIPAIISKIFNIPYVTEINGIIKDEEKKSKMILPLIIISEKIEKYSYKS